MAKTEKPRCWQPWVSLSRANIAKIASPDLQEMIRRVVPLYSQVRRQMRRDIGPEATAALKSLHRHLTEWFLEVVPPPDPELLKRMRRL